MALASSVALAVPAALLVGLPASSGVAQQPAQRVVQARQGGRQSRSRVEGRNCLSEGWPRRSRVKSYIASDDGSYRFGQLAQTTDYTVWAEHEGRKSAVKSISSFDTRNQFNIMLKIDK